MGEDKEKTAFICSRDSLDGAYPPLILATNAVRQGMESKVFFTFMGMNLLLKGGLDKSKFIPSGVMGAIPGMSTMATSMMKKKMDKANIPSLSELQEMAEIEADLPEEGEIDAIEDSDEPDGIADIEDEELDVVDEDGPDAAASDADEEDVTEEDMTSEGDPA